MNFERAKSAIAINNPKTAELTITTQVDSNNSFRVDQETFLSSTTTSAINFFIFVIISLKTTGLAGLEPTPTVLETAALPLELQAYIPL